MFAKPMFSMLVWSYCVTGHLNSNGHEAAITSSAAKIGGTGKTLNESVKNAGDCWRPFLVENEMCARRFHLAVSLQRRGTGGRPLWFFLPCADPLSSGPKSAADLATAAQTHPAAIYRLMRAVASKRPFSRGLRRAICVDIA
jgi:hypothetical protein